MLFTLLGLVNWVELPHSNAIDLTHVATITYTIHESFCDDILPYFREDRLLSFRTFTCDDIKISVRDAFNAWQYHIPVAFKEGDSGQITVSSQKLSDSKTIAQAEGSLSFQEKREVRIKLNSDKCWYTDNNFCKTINDIQAFLVAFVTTLWVTSGLLACTLLFTPYQKIDATLRLVVWSIVFSCPLIWWTAIGPCRDCMAFSTTVMHEIGHLIGLGHPDDEDNYNLCGCGSLATECPPRELTVMNSILSNEVSSCLTQDDVDGARTLLGGNCSETVHCYDEVNYTGFARITTAFIYAFLLSWILLCCRNCASHHKMERYPSIHTPQLSRVIVSKRKRTLEVTRPVSKETRPSTLPAPTNSKKHVNLHALERSRRLHV